MDRLSILLETEAAILSRSSLILGLFSDSVGKDFISVKLSLALIWLECFLSAPSGSLNLPVVMGLSSLSSEDLLSFLLEEVVSLGYSFFSGKGDLCSEVLPACSSGMRLKNKIAYLYSFDLSILVSLNS